jgi:hypothetical protein
VRHETLSGPLSERVAMVWVTPLGSWRLSETGSVATGDRRTVPASVSVVVEVYGPGPGESIVDVVGPAADVVDARPGASMDKPLAASTTSSDRKTLGIPVLRPAPPPRCTGSAAVA